MKKFRHLVLFAAALMPAAMSAAEATNPDIVITTSASELQVTLAGSEAATTFQIDKGDGELADYTLPAGETADFRIERAAGKNPVKIYGVGETLEYFSIGAYNVTELTFNDCSKIKWLSCAHNALTSLDITGLPELLTLNCGYNDIQKLDISKSPKLEELNAEMNFNLGNINFSTCPALKSVNVRNASKINNVDVSKLPDLEYLCVESTGISRIDVTKNANLKRLNCNYIRYLYMLDVTKNPKLEELYIDTKTTYSRMKTLDVTNNPELRILFCSGQALSTLDLTKNTKLTSLFCSDNNLPVVDLSHNPDVFELSVRGNFLNFNTMPVPADSPQLKLYYYTSQRPMPLSDIEFAVGSKLDISAETYLEKYPTTYRMYLTDSMDPSKATELEEGVDFSVDKGVVSLLRTQADSVYIAMENEGFPSFILETARFMIKEADDLGKPDLAIEFTTDISPETNVTIGLSALRSNSKIFIDWGDGEQKEYTIQTYVSNYGGRQSGVLKGRKVKVYTAKGVQLKDIQLGQMQITDIDLSKSHAVQTIDLSNNNLAEINFDGNRKISQVTLDGNKLKDVSFIGHNFLQNISVCQNLLESIEFSRSQGLKTLKVSNNKLKGLNLGEMKALEYLEANNNLIETLDLTDCVALTDLRVRDNYLSELNLKNNAKLSIVWVDGNKFLFSTMPETDSPTFSYSSQKKVEIPTASFIVDLSSEYQIGGSTTVYKWQTSAGTRLFEGEDYTIENGVTRFLNTDFDAVYCEMTNATWPRLTLKTTEVKPMGMPDKVIAGFTAKEDVGAPIRMSLATFGNNYVFIDFGDGNLVNKALHYDYSIVEGVLGKNREVKIYTYSVDPVRMRVFSVTDFAMNSVALGEMPDVECINLTNGYLKDIDLSANLKLKELTLTNNRLSSIDLSKHTMLTMLSLNNCGLKNVDLSAQKELTWLSLSNLGLESVDLSAQSKLKWLSVSGNRLTTLDLSAQTVLRELYASDNLLKSINLDNQPDMAYVGLAKNHFKFSTFPYHNINNLAYTDQADVEVKAVNGTVDISSEARVNNFPTEYKWVTVGGTELVKGTDYTIKDGVTTFLTSPEEDVICEMTNGFFPELILKTVAMPVEAYSGIESIAADANAEVRVYDLSGVLVRSVCGRDTTTEDLAPGFYIIETFAGDNRSVSKIRVK